MSKLSKYILPVGLVFCLAISLFFFNTCSLESVQSDKLKVGATYMTLNKPYFQVINNEVEKEIRENGDILYTKDPALDADKQAEQIQNFIDMGVDVIIVNPIDSFAIEENLLRAKEEGIKIIVIDTPLENENIADCTVTSNNYQAGVLCALDMMEKIEKARIVLLEHNSVISGRDRIQGFCDTIANNPNYVIVKELECLGQTVPALNAMRDYLSRSDDFQVVMCLNDTAALGVLAALEEQNKEDVLVYGVDGAPEIKALIAQSNVMEGSASQSPIQMGKKAIYAAYRLTKDVEIGKEIFIGTELITKDNISKFSISGWQ
ncbi:MAG: sugar ABC transporter substrate-binding protein [Bacillota bacterium]|nr:sugar ABC transporter substrate-binding protein [Bacillota bacterium]